jgi:alkylation response protein AidB-like acyl-CoA dehydrogenase
VDFDLDADQQALQETTRRFAAARYPMDVVRGQGAGLDRDRWRDLARLGVFDGGLDPVDVVLAFEELGRALVPGPLTASALAGAMVKGVASGDVVVTLVERAERADGPVLVEHGAAADVVLVLDGDGVHRVDASALGGRPVANPLDPTTPLTLVERLPAGEPLAGPEVAAAWRRTGSLLTAALLLGIAGATTDVAVAYARHRHQFGRPIGSFQAVKHLLADMFARAEVARASVHAAGILADDERAVAGARVLAGGAALDNARSCIQVHGGVGFTWEADPHLYLKRALLHDTQLGSVDEAAETVARHLRGA